MPPSAHLIFFVSYTVIAVAAAVLSPDWTGLSPETAWTAGLLLLVLGLGCHGWLARMQDRRDQDIRMKALEADLRDLADATDTLADSLDRAWDDLEKGQGRNQEVLSELKMLHTLLSQVVTRSGKLTKVAPATLQEMASPEDKPGSPAAAETMTEDEMLEVVRSALSENRIDLYLQPIVTLPSRRTRHYEAFSRVRDEDGNIIFPRDYIPLAENTGLIGTLDNLLLFRCIQLVRRLGTRRRGTRFFINISSESLGDEEFFSQFIDFMANNADLSDRLIFEFMESDISTMSDSVWDRMQSLSRRGYMFSVDRVPSTDLDWAKLAARHIHFAKIDIDVLLAGAGDIHPADIKKVLDRNKISLIVSKIEEEQSVPELLDFGVELAQGYLFSEPRLSRDEPREEE